MGRRTEHNRCGEKKTAREDRMQERISAGGSERASEQVGLVGVNQAEVNLFLDWPEAAALLLDRPKVLCVRW